MKLSCEAVTLQMNREDDREWFWLTAKQLVRGMPVGKVEEECRGRRG